MTNATFSDAAETPKVTRRAVQPLPNITQAQVLNRCSVNFICGKISPRGTDAFIIMRVREIFMDMASIIGIFENIPEEKNVDDELVNKLMNIIISIRQDARSAKNWAVADKIRDELKATGILLEDTPQGVKWKNV